MLLNLMRKVIKALKIISWRPRQIKSLRLGVALAIEHKDSLKPLNLDVLIDAGANKGQFSLLAKELKSDLIIFAFEPLKPVIEIFEKVLKPFSSVTLFPYALGESVEEKSFHVSKEMDSSSLLPITALQNNYFPGTSESYVETVKVNRLDNIISEADLSGVSMLKIDVQGYELGVLKGAERILDFVDYIYVECSYVEFYEGQPLVSEVLSYLFDKNYLLTGIFNTTYSKENKPLQSDYLLKKIN